MTVTIVVSGHVVATTIACLLALLACFACLFAVLACFPLLSLALQCSLHNAHTFSHGHGVSFVFVFPSLLSFILIVLTSHSATIQFFCLLARETCLLACLLVLRCEAHRMGRRGAEPTGSCGRLSVCSVYLPSLVLSVFVCVWVFVLSVCSPLVLAFVCQCVCSVCICLCRRTRM